MNACSCAQGWGPNTPVHAQGRVVSSFLVHTEGLGWGSHSLEGVPGAPPRQPILVTVA